jgi:hypothetical protein
LQKFADAALLYSFFHYIFGHYYVFFNSISMICLA